MPTGLQANNLSPMGFGQPNMRRAAAQQPSGYGMPERPVAPGQQPKPQAPPGGAGTAPKMPSAMGVPSLYKSPLAMQAKPAQFPADAVYNRVQQAILNPGPQLPPATTAPPPIMPGMSGLPGLPPVGPGQVNLGEGPMPVGRPPMSPGLLGPMAANYGPPPTGMGGPSGAPPDMAEMMQFMQQTLGGGR